MREKGKKKEKKRKRYTERGHKKENREREIEDRKPRPQEPYIVGTLNKQNRTTASGFTC